MTKLNVIVALIATMLISGCATTPKINTTKLPDEIRAEQVKDLKFGMFICWSFSTFSGHEWTPTLDKDASYFKATGCDTDQWCQTAKAAGMNYILFLSKHHDGFCLWDTATTDKKVTNSPLGIDVLAKLRKSCDKYGIKLALYFSEGDWNWPGAVDGKGTKPGGTNPEMKKAQLKELLTQYGPIEFWWMDHAVGTGGLSHKETVEWVHKFQPNSFVGFNQGQPAGRIVLRERGRPGKIGDTSASFYGSREEQYKGYLAAEFTYPILPKHKGGAGWFYSLPKHDSLCHPADKLYNDYVGAMKYGNIFSIDVGPNYQGRLRDIDVKTLTEVGEMIKSENSTLQTESANAQANDSDPGLLKLTIEQITFGTKHRLFGYIGQSLTTPWNASERYILSLESEFHDHMPTADEAAKIMIIDTHNKYKIEYVDETHAWNLQQGTMMYWNPESHETQFFFNDRDAKTGKIFTVLYDIKKRKRVKEYRFEDTPVGNSGVASLGGYFLAINYARMERLRPITGYLGAYDWTEGQKAPLDDGIFKVNIKTGKKELLVNYKQLADLCDQHTASYYINHTLWNRANDKILFYARGAQGSSTKLVNKIFTVNSDGTGLTMQKYIGGHPEWGMADIAIGAIKSEQVLYDVVKKKVVGTIGKTGTFAKPGGDISLSPNGKMFANGFSISDGNFYTIYRMTDDQFITSTEFSRGPYSKTRMRIDGAPRWNRTGNKLLVPGWIDNARQLFIITIEGAAAGRISDEIY